MIDVVPRLNRKKKKERCLWETSPAQLPLFPQCQSLNARTRPADKESVVTQQAVEVGRILKQRFARGAYTNVYGGTRWKSGHDVAKVDGSR
jgi:hypothetical protein